MNVNLLSAVSVAAGGAAGALCRWLIALLVNRFVPSFPLGTMIINVLGSFLLGWIMASQLNSTLRLMIAVGFLGAFTTFSTFMYESNALANERAVWGFSLNIMLSLAIGLIAMRLGLALGAAHA